MGGEFNAVVSVRGVSKPSNHFGGSVCVFYMSVCNLIGLILIDIEILIDALQSNLYFQVPTIELKKFNFILCQKLIGIFFNNYYYL